MARQIRLTTTCVMLGVLCFSAGCSRRTTLPASAAPLEEGAAEAAAPAKAAGPEKREGTCVVPTHPRLVFRKDDLPGLRQRCLTTHAREYAKLKADGDRAAFLETTPVAPGLLYQLTGESRYLRWAETDYDAFHEVLDPEKARALANDVLYDHRRRMSPKGDAYLGEGLSHYMHLFGSRTDVLTIVGDDVPLARPGEMEGRLRELARVFAESRQVYDLVAHRRGGKATSFHCACFFGTGPTLFEKWRVATGENYFGDALLAGLILQAVHNTLPLDHACAAMTNSWGHDHVGRPADYIIASRARDGLCQWVIHNPAWATARDVGKPDPADFDALGHAWVDATRNLGGYKEASWTVPVAWWVGHMPERILYYDPSLTEVPQSSLPTSALFEGLGIVCMRSTWDDDAVFTRLHSGPNFRGEPPHLNDNTFVLYHKGVLVKPERSVHVLTSNANSVLVKDPDETIMVTGSCGGLWPDAVWNGKAGDLKPSKENDGGQSYWTDDIGRMNLKARGHIAAYESTDLFTYSVGDATRSYNPAKLKGFTRQFLYLKPALVLICDRVEGTKPEFEKRWVLHTKDEPRALDGGKTFLADAIDRVTPGGVRGWERTPGFEDPVNEKEPTPKTTLRFTTHWDGVELGLVHKVGPVFGKVEWTLDRGRQKGTIDQNAGEEKAGVETVLLRDIPKGKHTLEVVWPTERINYAFFTVRLGGRVFVTTLLPEKHKREVRANEDAQKDRFSIRSDWRTDVVPAEARTDDVFLHLVEAADRSREKPLAVQCTGDDEKTVLTFAYAERRYEVTFNRTGVAGGHVRVRDAQGNVLADKNLATGIIDTDDAHIERCRALMKEAPHYDYDVSEIAHLTPRAETATLVKALGHPRWYVRFYAVRALAAKRDRAAAGKLMTLLAEGDPRVASAAAETLGRLGAKEAEPLLLKALTSPESEVRFHAAAALGDLRSKAAVEPLARLLSDANDFVAVSAAEALAKIADPRAVDPLAREIDRRETSHMKASCLWAIATIGGDDAKRHLDAFTSSEDGTLRACALAGLVKLSGKDDATAFLLKARQDAEKDIQSFARRKLAEFGDRSMLEELAATARDEGATFPGRVAALERLGELRYKPAADEIAPLLEDQKLYPYPYNRDSVSVHAALALYRLGDARGVKFLAEGVMMGAEQPKLHVARAAAKALASVEKDTAVPILMKGLEVRRSQVGPEIVQALWRVTGEDPGADIVIVGWRRSGLDTVRWREWWANNKAAYPQPAE
ncbi:MAG TPA: HEAT repeat domain-containing protein [Planctomycetota bacterium]|nr:HEAT repeat domain-containing protein [Planctomycetota bacterium]